jgi:hypothetical protein
MNATICPQQVLSLSLGGQRRDTSLACLRPSLERTRIILSSSCNAALFAIGEMQGFKLPNAVFVTAPRA